MIKEQIMYDGLLDLLKALIRIPSVNDGKSEKIPEAKMAEFIAEYLKNIGMDCEYRNTSEGRPNLIGRWPGGKSGRPVLVFNAHMDTVNIDGMTIEPFGAEVKDGKIYGRGSCDTKGPMSVLLWVLKQISDRRNDFDREIQFLATCDEEYYCGGSRWLVENGYHAAEMIIGEPTSCLVGVAHRGLAGVNLVSDGRCAHASVPESGENAIYKMSEAISSIRNDFLPQLSSQTHPMLGTATAAVTVIKGGHRSNIIPDKCQATMDIRLLPSQSAEEIVKKLEGLLDGLCSVDCTIAEPGMETEINLPFVQKMLQAAQSEPVGLPYLADSGQFSQAGINCIVFGPGKLAQAHSADEYLEIGQLHRAADMMMSFVKMLE